MVREMRLLVRIELFKIRTIRLSYGLMAATAGLTALSAVLEGVGADLSRHPGPWPGTGCEGTGCGHR